MRSVSVAELLRSSYELYRRNIRLVLSVTVPIVVVVTALTGLGLGEFTARLNPAPPVRDVWIDTLASELVTAPLVSAILARWVFLSRTGETASATDLVANALEAFPAVLLVIVIWLAVSALGAVTLILPGIYVFVSWYFVVQAVVIDGDRGLAPIGRSATLVRGHWWQSAATGLAFLIASYLPPLALQYAFTPLARSVNSYAVVVGVVALARVVTLPFVAIGASLYYLHLRDSAPRPARP